MNKEPEEFKLKTREEVEKFQSFLHGYSSIRRKSSLRYIDLVKAYDQLQENPFGGQIFTALLDLKINFILLNLDMHEFGATWNTKFAKGKLEGGSILDSLEKFVGKMDIHRHNTAFIFRYRAMWDKIFGLYILQFSPDKYEQFIKATKRKKFFEKVALKIPQIDHNFVTETVETITQFDEEFRTPEAHRTGRLRKFSFTMQSITENPIAHLIGYWNRLLQVITDIDKIYK